MDKNFNDQELSDIMKEIEALEEDFQDAGQGKIEAPVSVAQEYVPEEKEEEPVHVEKHAEVVAFAQPKHHHKVESKASTSMSFKVSGELHLDLQFDVGGKVVALEVTEQGLFIKMDGGMTFSIPLKKSA